MKAHQLTFVAAIAAATLPIGCATTGPPATVGLNAIRGPVDAVIHVNGLS